jgi:hypothetical protein
MFNFVTNSRILFWNLIILVAIKGAFAYPTYWVKSTITDERVYSSLEVISETNKFRASLGLGPLKESQSLNIAAAQKLQDMIANQYFSHFSPQGVSPWHWFKMNHYNYSYAGENLAIGFLDAKSNVQGWIDSPSHRKNLTGANYQDIGVAVAAANINGTEGILTVQLFGKTTVAAAKQSDLSIGFSGASADTTPLPTPTATISTPTFVPTIAITQTPTPFLESIASLEDIYNVDTKENTLGNSAFMASSDLDQKEPPVIAKAAHTDPKINTMARKLNQMLIFYTLFIVLVSLFYLSFNRRSKMVLTKTTINFAVFLAAVLIPILQVTQVAMIR